MKTGIIALVIGLILALVIVVLIKINSPLGIVMKQGFKQLNRITLIDKEKVKELENELKISRFQRDSIMKIQRNLLAENRTLYLSLDNQERINFQLNKDLTAQKAKVRELSITPRLLSPTQNTQLFDNTTGSVYALSVLMEGNFVKTPLERIIEANYIMAREKEFEIENAIQEQLIKNLELSNGSLRIINSNLEEALVHCNMGMELTLEEKDQYKKLYLEGVGKTRKGLFIAYGIIVVETIVLVWVLTR